MFEGFRAFGLSDDEWAKQQILQDGVPAALQQPLRQWLVRQLEGRGGYALEQGVGFIVLAKTGIDLGETAVSRPDHSELLRTIAALSPPLTLRLTDFVLAMANDKDQRDALDFILSLGSSKWAPGWDGELWRLVARVPDGVQDAVESASEVPGGAGPLLRQAWVKAFGLEPDAGGAYKMAVKAVETAAHLHISPNNAGATLGTMISNLRDQEGWTLPYAERADHVGSNKQVVLLLMQTMWEGQEDRHRDGTVGIDEARTAVYAAATLVAWFSAGYVTKAE